MYLKDPPYPDHPLFNWDFQWHPSLGSCSLYERSLKEREENERKDKTKRTFGFAQALEDS
jgi:hypothetical protein